MLQAVGQVLSGATRSHRLLRSRLSRLVGLQARKASGSVVVAKIEKSRTFRTIFSGYLLEVIKRLQVALARMLLFGTGPTAS